MNTENTEASPGSSERRSGRVRLPPAKLRESAEEEPPKKVRKPKAKADAPAPTEGTPEPKNKPKKATSRKKAAPSLPLDETQPPIAVPAKRGRRSNLQTPDQLNIEGQTLLQLYELEEESRTLKTLHDQITEQLRLLAIEEHAFVNKIHNTNFPQPELHEDTIPIHQEYVQSSNSAQKQFERSSNLRSIVAGNVSFDMYNHSAQQVEEDQSESNQRSGQPANHINIVERVVETDEDVDMKQDLDDDEFDARRMRREMRARLGDAYVGEDDEDEEDEDTYEND